MTEYQKQRQKFLKTREDTICFTRDELHTILDILKETMVSINIGKRARAWSREYLKYRLFTRCKVRTVYVDNIKIELRKRVYHYC